MKIEMLNCGTFTAVVRTDWRGRRMFWNHSAGAFLGSPNQATHYRSRRLAESVWHRQILAQEAKPMPPQADGTLDGHR